MVLQCCAAVLIYIRCGTVAPECLLWFHVVVNVKWITSPRSAGGKMWRGCNAIIQTLGLKHGRVVIDVLNEDCDGQVGGGAVPPVTRQTEPETNNWVLPPSHPPATTNLMKCVGLLWSARCSRDFASTMATCLLSTSRNVKNPSALDWKWEIH